MTDVSSFRAERLVRRSFSEGGWGSGVEKYGGFLGARFLSIFETGSKPILLFVFFRGGGGRLQWILAYADSSLGRGRYRSCGV